MPQGQDHMFQRLGVHGDHGAEPTRQERERLRAAELLLKDHNRSDPTWDRGPPTELCDVQNEALAVHAHRHAWQNASLEQRIFHGGS